MGSEKKQKNREKQNGRELGEMGYSQPQVPAIFSHYPDLVGEENPCKGNSVRVQ